MLPCAAKQGPALPPAQSMHAPPGVGGAATGRVDDAELAVLAAVVGRRQPLDHLGRAQPLGEQREPVGAVARVRVGLRRDRPDTRLRPRHDRADREELRLRRDAPLRRLEVAGGDRVGCDDRTHRSGEQQGAARLEPVHRRVGRLGARARSGVPCSSGKVPKWQGMHSGLPSSSSASAASRGPIVKWSPIGSTA